MYDPGQERDCRVRGQLRLLPAPKDEEVLLLNVDTG